jgi:hypothetical protein
MIWNCSEMKRLVCYAHFDGKSQVRPFVLHALQVMAPLCIDLVFISNSSLADHDRALLSKSCSNIIVNNNTGYDFYMWKLGLESVDLSLYDEVVLMNSSVFGPLFDMEEAFLRMGQLPCDFWGITECFQMQPHLQTYFLVFNKKVIASDAFKAFWCGILPYINKMQVIQSYEVGLTQWLVESGFQPGVLCPFDSIGEFCTAAGKRLRRKDNASVKFAAELLEAGSPFLKRDAVRNRKVAIDLVLPLVQKRGYPTTLIDEKQNTADQSCPVCGSSGRLWRKGVRNFTGLHDTERYDYLRCTSNKCGMVWLKAVGQSVRFMVAPVNVNDNKMTEIDSIESAFQTQSDLLLIVGGDISSYGSSNVSSSRVFFAKATDTGEVETLSSSTPKGGYDVVILMNALEQVHDSKQLLKSVCCLLKPGGMLYVETLNADSLVGALFQGYWSCLRAPYVRRLFSDRVLHSLLASRGFEGVQVTSHFRLTSQSVFASFEAVRTKRVSPKLMTALKPRWRTGGIRFSTLVNKLIPSWGETWCVVARKRKDL